VVDRVCLSDPTVSVVFYFLEIIMEKPIQRNLHDIFIDFPFDVGSTIGEAVITNIVSDSRQVTPGCLFVAVRGNNFDGHRFIPEVIAKGAAAIVGMEAAIAGEIPYIQVANTRRALPFLAAAFYGNPAQRMTMIGVTGTDGKTTTTNLIFSILHAAGLKAGMVSTVNAVIGEQEMDTGFHVTTPEVVDVQRYLALMLEGGLTHAVLETTSHGLAQHRVDACEFDVAVITNITHEHLDEHGSLENYRNTKARLFQSLETTKPKPQGNQRIAILNKDDDSYPFLNQVCENLDGVQVLTYGLLSDAWVTAREAVYSPKGVSFQTHQTGQDWEIGSHLVGAYNISNILAAYAATVGGLGIDPHAAQIGIAQLPGIPGRMEQVDLGQDFLAIVDFAHTPNALKQTLETARHMTRGKVIVAFGSAGLRDRQKRRMMAETAVKLADYSILTAEDPRTESLIDILAEMADGARSNGGVEGSTFWRIPDRSEAIRVSLSLAKAGDIVLVCGKGHEQSMCFGKVEYAWDDLVAMRAALSDLLGIAGQKMPKLPTQLSY
jgi:UDP-N-acetylmuramoyl-L-alanyl-D-glutamate--2,6-diaminopimelate ligase